MGIKKSLIVSLTIALILFPQLYFCNENKVLSQNSNVTSNVNSVEASNNSVEASKDDDLWRDLWCMECGNDITIMKNGSPVPKNSKEYSKLLKVCEQY
ncbi:hypothetical protein [Paenibacillus popilliae]|uniref:Signal transduction histidine kinase n=1 Tax=Paenibacillus popilliae ATCC 14706 TaxID=1212764 RepID=M9LKL0_PAEPP|nr:hypothetical protein [Paenibacillus popilliae]GAC43865.1 signal transduction histidine kinase [Paenibacillus popilliae ATCC 14706]